MKHINFKKTTLLGLTCLLGSQFAVAEPETRVGADFVGEVVFPVTTTVNLKQGTKPNVWKPGDPIKEIPMRFRRPKDWERPAAQDRGFGVDPLALKQWNNSQAGDAPEGSVFENTIVNVDGLGFTGVNPSDTNGDIGIDHYIQSINNGASSGILILNKADGTTAAQFVLDDIAAGSGTGCGAGNGDPVIIYDQFVDNGVGNPKGRWVLTEFTGNSLCIYISQTHSPIGPTDDSTWHIYEFISASGGLPDYPKFGVWGDAYYMGANESNRQYAFDRDNMINGDPARGYQVFQTVGLPGFGFQHLMPADGDGVTEPPAGAPGIFMRHRDAQYHGDPGGTPDRLEIWEFTTDFDTPANSSITGPINIDVSDFDTNLGGTNFADLSVPQPGGATNLFPLKQPLMWRVQHQTILGKQFLVGNMTTDVNGNDYHGVRWWVLERPEATVAGGWILSDEGTYTSGDGITTGDGVHRWMASAAMDSSGNLAIGYNTSAVTGNNNSAADVFAGMRYAGRLFTDPAGTMPRGEASIIEGSASNSSGRYGDYTSISVDPVDGCTFWYTAQYNTSGNWSTRIASFKFDACGEPSFALSSTAGAQNVCTLNGDVDFDPTIEVLSVNSFVDPVTLAFNPALPTGFSGSFVTNPIVPGNSTDANIDISSAGATSGDYTLIVEGTSGMITKQLAFDVTVWEDVPQTISIPTAPANGAVGVPTSGAVLSWDPAAAGVTGFLVEIATDSGFSNIIESATVPTPSYQVTTGLNSNTEYFWRVTHENTCGLSTSNSIVQSFTTANEICLVQTNAIPDNDPTGVDMQLVVGDTGTIDDLIVEVDATHTWVGDLVFTLTHEDTGTSVTLMDRPGVPASTFGCGDNDVDASFDDTSGNPVETECSATPPAIGGSVQPQQALSAFDGEDITGTWTLNANDNAGADTGQLNGVCLVPTLTPVVDPCDTPPPVGDPDVIWFNGFQCVQATP